MSNQPTNYQSIIAKTWTDAEYKTQLINDPKAVLKEAGVQIPENVEVKVLVDTDEVVHMVLPASPAGEAISEQDLKQVAGGTLPVSLFYTACVYC